MKRSSARLLFPVAVAATCTAFGSLADPSMNQEMDQNVPLIVDFGTISGIAYYTRGAGAYHLNATLEDETPGARPLQLEMALAPGQSLTFSSPRGRGRIADTLTISRVEDRIFTHGSAKTGQPGEAMASEVLYTVGR